MKKTVIILSLFVMAMFPTITASANDAFSGGSGTADDPYIVTSADQLNEVRYYLDSHFIQTRDIDLSIATAPDGDYYDNGNGWLPIGDYSNSFTGTYNGNGHSITGMTINRTSTSSLYTGLFYSVTGCIENLNIIDCNISAKASSTYGSVYCGAVSAIAKEDCKIINCSVTGSITTSSTYSSLVGGIIGNAEGGTTEKIKLVKGCSTDLTMTVTAKASDGYGTISTGGLIGSGDIMEIRNCNSSGKIEVYPCKSNFVGGISGKIEYDALVMDWCSNNSQINVCYGTNSSDSSSHYVGGLIGKADLNVLNPTGSSMTISNCYNSGNIYSKIGYTSLYNMVGGIIGYATNNKYDCNVINCYNIGNIIGEGSASYNDIGGIIGENNGFTIKNCYNSSSISAKTSKASASEPNVGAICGYSTVDVLNTYWNISASQSVNDSTLTDDKKIGVGPSKREDTAISMSPAKMKSAAFVDNLNEYLPELQYWKSDAENVNKGYPILVKNVDEDETEVETSLQGVSNIVNNHIVLFVKSNKEIIDEMLHIALYDNDGILVDYIVVPTIEPFFTTNVVFENNPTATTAKIFLWNSTETMKPLTNAELVEIR